MARERPKVVGVLSPEDYESLGLEDPEDKEIAEMAVAIVERFGNALFYTGMAVVSPSQGGHELAQHQWRELGKQMIQFTKETDR